MWDPINKRDPKGLYTCDGGKDDCKQIEGFYNAINKAAGSYEKGSAEQKALTKVTDYLGKPGEKNGVTVAATKIEGKAWALAGPNGKIQMDVGKLSSVSDASRAANSGKSDADIATAQGAGALGHEANHQLDFKANGFPKTRADYAATEKNAYTTDALIGQGLGVNSGLYSSWMSPQERGAAIQGGVDASVGIVCGINPAIPGC